MARLIDADALVKGIETAGKTVLFYGQQERRMYAEKVGFALRHIEAAPTIEAEAVRHAEWVFDENADNHRCSLCGTEALGDPNMVGWDYIMTVASEFCPRCGAKMDVKDREE